MSICRTAPLTSRCCILFIYSTNIRTEYFKHAAHSPFFPSSKYRLFHNATFIGSCIVHILHTGCAKIKKKKILAPKGLQHSTCTAACNMTTISEECIAENVEEVAMA
jgi:hypothetical protein